jgi:Leucine-rich repeat (LRR) protein
LVALPESFADLSVLTTLDLSQNALTSLPTKLFALPSLAILNISHNAITALSFHAPFSKTSSHLTQSSAGSFFAPVITYATTPLPKLHTLDASHNQLQAGAIDHADADLPVQLSKIDLSGNPLGNSQSLIRALGRLDNLKELRMEKADISDDSIQPDTLLSSTSFPKLRVFDLGQTKVTTEAVRTALAAKVKQQLNFDFTTEDPPAGVMRVLVGKPVVKEPWELEAERKARMRADRAAETSLGEQDGITAGLGKSKSGEEAAAKEPWEIEAEQGLLTEGGRRRARAAAAAAASPAPAMPAPKPAKKEIQKEAWEIEAEQGLLTEGGRRRARAAAVEEAKAAETLSTKPSSSGTSLTSPQYYSEKTSTLTLPPSVSASKGHSRAFSHAPSVWPPSRDSRITDIAIPTPTLPLGIIASQPFARTLKILTLTNRRLDVSLDLPANSESDLLPNLEELNLEGCSLRDTVPVSQHKDAGAIAPPRVNQPLLPLLVRLFPNLQTLDLSDNVLTAAALQADVLASLILAVRPSSEELPLRSTRKGLKHLRLRGNRIADLDGFQGLAAQFKGNRTVPEWKLEELDLRDNEIGRLPPELGLLPLDIFLVDGNV